MTPEDEKRVKELILKKLGQWSIDLTQYQADLLTRDDYTGSYALTIRHKLTGRKLKIPHIFVYEQTQEVTWDNVKLE